MLIQGMRLKCNRITTNNPGDADVKAAVATLVQVVGVAVRGRGVGG